MTQECTIVELLGNTGDPVRYTVTDGATIEKGTLCIISDPRTAAANTASGAFIGIAAAEKVASDGSTSLALYTNGIFDIWATSGAAILAGQYVKLSGANYVTQAGTADIEMGTVVGKALETTAAGVFEQILVKIGGVC